MQRSAPDAEQFRALVEQVPVVTYTERLSDTDTFTYFSPQIEALLGFSPAELVDRPRAYAERIHPDDRPAAQLEAKRATATDEPFRMEYRVQARDGRWLRVRDEAILVRDDAGRPLHWQGVIVDMTEQRQAEAALSESEERFRAAFDYAPIGLAIVTPDGRFRQVNRSLCELTGYSEDELLNLTFQEITHPDDLEDNLELVERLWNGEIDSYQVEKRYVRKDGHPVWIELTSSAVRDPDGARYAISQIQDVTGRRNLDLERATMLASERAYTKQLHDLAGMREDLSKMVAHELRSPVAALRMMATTLASGALPSDAEADMIAAIHGQIDQLDRLISDVTAAAAAERADFAVQLHPVPLGLLLSGAASFARHSLGARPFSIGSIPDLQVWCDPERVSQVLQNLLDNIAKHTPPGTPVELRAIRRGNRVRIEVADRGPGIAPEDLSIIFEKFGRGRGAFEGQKAGLGLGLYLSRQIVEAHGSDLTVQSAPGQGTVFRFDLRVAQ
jgi:PAS domain S-box-containing protein